MSKLTGTQTIAQGQAAKETSMQKTSVVVEIHSAFHPYVQGFYLFCLGISNLHVWLQQKIQPKA